MSSDKISPLQIENPPALARSCWFLTGATATGKTSVSLEMARRLDAEIISLDSMAIYRGMDIGTAKPSLQIRQRFPHHLIDIVDPPDSFSVSQYQQSALEKIGEIQGRGKQVLFVGGTALYLKVLLRGMFEGPPADWNFRNQIQAELQEMGAEFLHQRLEMVDPVSAHLIHPNDQRRIIRALEVLRLTGKPISHWQMQFDEGRRSDECRVFTLRHPRSVLHERIERRVEQMFEIGLIDEVSGLLQRYQQLGKTASQAVGYREVIDHLEGKLDLQQTVEQVKSRTRKFARHQETWFRGLSECRMIDLAGELDPGSIAEQLIELGRQVPTPEN
jgi:tRNA dimethylallyltransferase